MVSTKKTTTSRNWTFMGFLHVANALRFRWYVFFLVLFLKPVLFKFLLNDEIRFSGLGFTYKKWEINSVPSCYCNRHSVTKMTTHYQNFILKQISNCTQVSLTSDNIHWKDILLYLLFSIAPRNKKIDLARVNSHQLFIVDTDFTC